MPFFLGHNRERACVERQSSGVRRNVRQRSGRDLFCIAAVKISDPDIVAALESDFSLCPKRGRRNGQKQRNANSESFHTLAMPARHGALTVGKRAFLMRSSKSLPLVDIR